MAHVKEYGKTEAYDFRSTRITVEGKQKPKTEIFLGLELEVDKDEPNEFDDYVDFEEMREELASDLEYLDEGLEFKEDCSLSEQGFEIVTQPMTLEYHMNDYPWDRLTQTIKDHDYLSFRTETCGLHISASRKPIRPSSELKLVYWWTNLDKIHRKICKRPMGSYCSSRIVGKKDVSDYVKKKQDVSSNFRHGNVINLSSKDRIEFRQFKGNLNHKTILASLSYVDAILRFCEYAPYSVFLNLSRDSWNQFLVFISKDKKYKILREYLDNVVTDEVLEDQFSRF